VNNLHPFRGNQPAAAPITRKITTVDKSIVSPLDVLEATALNKSKKNYHNGDHQKDMNESTHGIRRDKTKEPKDNENDCNCLKHGNSPFS
jgi:hypothetical protein